jgi:hypothetical protein
MKITSVVERHPNIQTIHRLAVVDQFKGNHDAVGKDPARAIRAMELSGKQTTTAKDVFVNCRVFEKSRDNKNGQQWSSVVILPEKTRKSMVWTHVPFGLCVKLRLNLSRWMPNIQVRFCCTTGHSS